MQLYTSAPGKASRPLRMISFSRNTLCSSLVSLDDVNMHIILLLSLHFFLNSSSVIWLALSYSLSSLSSLHRFTISSLVYAFASIEPPFFTISSAFSLRVFSSSSLFDCEDFSSPVPCSPLFSSCVLDCDVSCDLDVSQA